MAVSLNPAQTAAVEHDHGPLLVLAGAGSGKTRVVTQRIARLIEKGVPARSILAMTFTNKAAKEMHERVEKLIGAKTARELTVSTFHSFGLSVLRAETKALGFRGGKFAIFDQGDSTGVIREALRTIRADKGFDIGAILARISALKNAFIDPEALAKGEKLTEPSEYDEITELVYPRYMTMMRGFQAFDFDDLVCEVARLFKKREDVRDKYVKRFRYIIVDEYQDTNRAQLELVRLLGSEHKNVCVVGDDDQSIYAWRGADVRNILDFEQHFGGAKIVRLEENYRSSGAILAVASVVLEKSSARRHKKTIVPTRIEGERVKEIVCADSEVEAAFIGRTIDDLVRDGVVRRKEIAVLYRSNLQAPDLEAVLKERQIPMRMIGGTQFFERKEVKDLLAYLKVVLNPLDEISLRRVINYPARGIGETALERLGSHATANSCSLFTAVTRAHAVKDLPPSALQGCIEFVRIIDAARDRFGKNELSAAVARALAEDAKLKEDVYAGASNAAAARRWGNLEGMLNVFTKRDDRGLGDRDSLEEFLRLIALNTDNEEEQKGDVVTLTTMHGAKGLEFEVVFLVGLEEGLIPHARTQTERVTDVALEGTDSIDEERRLFYVAVTRAKDRLYLCRAERRAFRGKIVARTPSRFLAEIPEALLDRTTESTAKKVDVQTTLAGAAGLLAALGLPPRA